MHFTKRTCLGFSCCTKIQDHRKCIEEMGRGADRAEGEEGTISFAETPEQTASELTSRTLPKDLLVDSPF